MTFNQNTQNFEIQAQYSQLINISYTLLNISLFVSAYSCSTSPKCQHKILHRQICDRFKNVDYVQMRYIIEFLMQQRIILNINIFSTTHSWYQYPCTALYWWGGHCYPNALRHFCDLLCSPNCILYQVQ